MSLPARPVTPSAALLTPSAAPLRAAPPDDVTLDRPCEAFEVVLDTTSFDFAAVLEAACEASAAVEACRRAVRRAMNLVCRSMSRTPIVDMKKRTVERRGYAQMKQ